MTFDAKRSWFGMPGFAAMLILTIGPVLAQSGQVQMENGDPPPEPVLVQGSCRDGFYNPTVQAKGYTDAKGYFTLTASAQPQRGTNSAQLRNRVPQAIPGAAVCTAQAIAPGYLASSKRSSSGRILITLYPRGETEGYSVSATSLLAPKGARKAFEQGMKAMEDGNLEDAEKSFTEAVKVYDRYAEAWYQLGKVYRKLLQPEQARAAFNKSIAADPRYVDPYEDLSQLAFDRDDMEDLLDKTETLLRLNPYESPQAYYYSAVANLQLKHYEAGEERIREAIENDPNYEQPLEYYVLGFLLSGEGRLAEALGALDIYLALQPDGDSADEARTAMEKLQKRLQQPVLMPTKRRAPPKPVQSATPEAGNPGAATP